MIVSKSSFLKGFAPIIIEMAKRNMFPLLLCGPNPETSFAKSPSQKPIKENINFPGVEKVEFAYFIDFKQAEKIIKDHNITDILTIHFDKEFSVFFKRIKKNKVKTHYLQFYGDFLYFQPELINPIDNFMLYSKAMVESYIETYNLKDNFYLKKIKIVGNPNIDLAQKMNKWEIRKKYNLPENKKIILFFSTILELDFRRKNIFGSDNNPRSFASFEYQWDEQEIGFQKYHDPILSDLAVKGYHACGMRDYGKFDVRQNREGTYYFIDGNTNPAFGPKESDCALGTVMDLYGFSFEKVLIMLFTNVNQRLSPASRKE